MGLLKPLGQGTGYLKCGFLGFPKSGKTFTSIKLAIGLWSLLDSPGPIAMFDTEAGSEYVNPIVKDAIGMDLMGIRSRSFDDLMTVGNECVNENIPILIVDSISHVWRELCDSYLAGVNENLRRRGKRTRSYFELQDWGKIKSNDLWGRWTNFYLNSPLHIIICGRAGFEWDFETNDETGKKELVKTGTKMRVESEFGFEPSLLVEMERVREQGRIIHRALVLGDRFGLIDGKECDDPSFEFFRPHIEALKPGAHSPVSDNQSKIDVDDEGNDGWRREKRQRQIFCEEIQGLLVAHFPSQSSDDKKAKASMIEKTFNTRSWTAVENMDSASLKAGLESMRLELEGG